MTPAQISVMVRSLGSLNGVTESDVGSKGVVGRDRADTASRERPPATGPRRDPPLTLDADRHPEVSASVDPASSTIGAPATSGLRRPSRRWLLTLGLIMALALGVRFSYARVHTQNIGVISDPAYYHFGANLLAEGHGFVDPFQYLTQHRSTPGAYHPPGYIVALAVASSFGFKSLVAHQIWSAIIGTATVAVMAFAGRRLGGPRVGLLAALVAAVYPSFWFSDTLVMSETAMLLAVAATVLVAYRFWDHPSTGRARARGVACGVTVLCRAEAVLLLPLMVAPLVAFLHRLTWRRRLSLLALTGGAAAGVMAPWIIFNLLRFQEPVYLGVSDHTLLAGNCPDRYSGDLVGFWSIGCIVRVNCPTVADQKQGGRFPCLLRVRKGEDESTIEQSYRREGWRNIGQNLHRLPFVVFAREGRTWGFYRPGQQLQLDTISTRELGWSRLGLGMYYGLVAGSVVGLVALRRRRVPVFPLLAFIVNVALTVAVTFGETRYRALAEVPLVLSGAVGIDVLVSWVNARRRSRAPARIPISVPAEPVHAT